MTTNPTAIMRKCSTPMATGSIGLALILAGCGGSSTAPGHSSGSSAQPATTSRYAPAKPPTRSTHLLATATDPAAAAVAVGDTRPAGELPAAGFSWLRAGRPPIGWTRATIASGNATVVYPADWTPIPGDRGTVTDALRGPTGGYRGYLNVTPDQGAEPQNIGWAAFRIRRNREEGDEHVHQLAAADGLRFRDARGSCVIDDYRSGAGSHPYREIACIVTGRRHTSILVAAALKPDWHTVAPVLERAASTFLER
ncbi:MAG: hypothetical protein ACR2LV_00740 [Solirubrobacteraceae bacterium]